MTLPSDYWFDAYLPGLKVPVRISSLYEAQVFARRWTIRDKDRDVRAVLRKLEKADSAEASYAAMRNFRQALMSRGMLGDNKW